uniref:Uncharacterized protein n=1 Tax=Leersia perrieri TaxID=77586 RepID=A0A0D9WVI0_9ORYZ
MEGLIPLVYKAIVEYKKASSHVNLGSLFFVTTVDDQLCGDSGRWCYAATSPPASAVAQLVSPLLRSTAPPFRLE